ncbi:MAG: sensor histidine kinase [Chloroflexota bacterium]
MKHTEPDSGLLSAFRLLLLLRLLIQALTIAIPWAGGQTFQPYRALAILETLALVGYLSWTLLQRRLGRAYLPLALLAASAAPLLENALFFWLEARAGTTASAGTISQWELVLVLLPPLIVTGWQYSFRAVAAFALGTALLHLGLYLATAQPGRGAVLSLTLNVLVLRTLMFMLIGHLVMRLANAQRAQRDALARANARLLDYSAAVEKLTLSRERNRLARELHDTLAHSLSEIAVQLEALNTIWHKDPVRAQHILDQTLAAARDGLREARRAIQALRAAPLDDLGLTLAIRELAEIAAARAGLSLRFRAPESIHSLPPEVEQCIYRVAQEAIANAVEHSQAHLLHVELERNDGRLTLIVADDGCGFDPANPPAGGRFGLRGMRERAEMIGATLFVQSALGHGARICLSVEETG